MNLKNGLISLVAAGAIAVSLTGCGSSEPEGIYTCDAGKRSFDVKIDGQTWDAKIEGKWLMKEVFPEKKKEGDTINTPIKLDEATKEYTLNLIATMDGKKEDKNLISFSYDEKKDILNLTKFDDKSIKRKLRQDSVSCTKVK